MFNYYENEFYKIKIYNKNKFKIDIDENENIIINRSGGWANDIEINIRYKTLFLDEIIKVSSSNENTQKMISKPSTTMSDETIYSGLIKWSTTHPDIFERFKFPVPKYNKYDTLQTKINKMQNQGILVTENTFFKLPMVS